MRIVRHPQPGAPAAALAIGSFDGVHRGHAWMLNRVADEARARALESAVLTFEPLPREFFAPQEAPARLTTISERLPLIARSGIATAFVQRFDLSFSTLTPEEFAQRLRTHHGARWVIVGEDFRYGSRRAGDGETLLAAGRRLGFEVEILPAVTLDGIRASSTRVREALAKGDFAEAKHQLGRPYAITGRVMHGAKRGRGLGFPTANVRLGRRKAPLRRIFAGKCYGATTRGLEG